MFSRTGVSPGSYSRQKCFPVPTHPVWNLSCVATAVGEDIFRAHSVSCVPFLPYFDFFLALLPEICYTVFATQMNISHRKCLW